jgi:hypothetical protein
MKEPKGIGEKFSGLFVSHDRDIVTNQMRLHTIDDFFSTPIPENLFRIGKVGISQTRTAPSCK